MTTAPQINLFDGSGTTSDLVITTNLLGLIFTGQVDSNVIDIQIDINGSGFTSDPTLVDLKLPNFTVPNLSSFPDGLILDKGQNVIRLRALDLSGGVSPTSTITATVVSDVDLQTVMAPPTGIELSRRAKSIELSWSDVTPVAATGYNIYASTGPGGSGSGYLRVNSDMIPADSPKTTTIDEFPSSDTSFDASDNDGNDLVITAQIKNPVTNELVNTLAVNTTSLLSTPKFRYQIVVTNLVETAVYNFNHNRNDGLGNGILNSDTFSVIPATDPLYYVLTAVYYDKTTGVLQESRFSQELSGAPLALDTTVRGINIRDQSTVTQDYIKEIIRVEPQLSLIPGSTVREVHIEPFANEIQKAYFLADFVHRAQSFQALLQIDDPGMTGTGIPVANSAYKQNLKSALSSSSDAAVQQLIDSAFDILAQNYDVTRDGNRQSIVQQTFYTTTKPTRDLYVNQGAIVSSSSNSSAPRFRTQGSLTLSAANAQSYYNPDTKRYEITIQMIAEVAGSAGNVPAETLDTVVSGANGFKTINMTAAYYGLDQQSNLSLSEECSSKLSSLDTGTEGGYSLASINTPGVLETKIIKSGDDLMFRDYDSVRQKHIGGKVDVYVKGTIERTINETFAFQFDMAKNMRFDVIDTSNLIFRARDSRLTVNNPISSMLYNPSQDLGLRNHSVTPTESYDLTGVVIIDYRTIKLNNAIPQPTTLLDDFVEGDYRYISNNKFIPSFQPIIRVPSVTGEISGSLDSVLGYTIYKTQDPLLEGESTIAQDYITINQVDGVPSGTAIQVNNEQHVLIGQILEPLDSIGINTFTLYVYSQDRLILYNGPDSTNPDYLVVSGTETTPIKIVRTALSNISNGSTVSVDYSHDENFQVTYVINDVLQQLQAKYSKMRHITADVLVKQSIENPLSTEVTVQLKPNADQPTVDSTIRTGVTVLTDSHGIGQSIHQSDMTAVIDDTTGVDYIVQPFTKFTLQNGSVRLREQVLSDYEILSSLSMYANQVYILTQPLEFNTIDSGGVQTMHHGVYMDTLIMDMAPSLELIGSSTNLAWVIGSQGAIIPGYSDDATLAPIFITPAAIEAERLRRTANHVVISLNIGATPVDTPSNYSFTATYMVEDDVGSKDLTVSNIEYLTPGNLTITYRSA